MGSFFSSMSVRAPVAETVAHCRVTSL